MTLGTLLTPSWLRLINCWRRSSLRQLRLHDEKKDIEARNRIRAEAQYEEAQFRRKAAVKSAFDVKEQHLQQHAAAQLARAVFESRSGGLR